MCSCILYFLHGCVPIQNGVRHFTAPYTALLYDTCSPVMSRSRPIPGAASRAGDVTTVQPYGGRRADLHAGLQPHSRAVRPPQHRKAIQRPRQVGTFFTLKFRHVHYATALWRVIECANLPFVSY